MANKGAAEAADRDTIREILTAARRARHRIGRELTKETKARAAAHRHAGRHERAKAIEAAIDRRSYALIQKRRRQEELELRRFWRPIRVKVEEARRPKFKKVCPANLYRRFEYGTGGVGQARERGHEREVFLQWIGRGFKSGRARAGKRPTMSRTGRNRPWRAGEAGRMVRYICRPDALEAVDKPVFTNIGRNLPEWVAFFREVERIEAEARSDASVYHHVIVALPHDIVPEERAQTVDRVLKPLRDLNLGFVAALHKPDKDGDQRNFHLHIVLSLRPMKRFGDYEWEFAAIKTTWLDTPAGLLLMRRHLAREFNRALQRAGSPVRWTHLSRAERGLASPGNTKRRPGDRHEQAAARAEQALREAQGRRDGIERLAAVIETLDVVVDGISKQREALAALAAAAAARLTELHSDLLALADRAAKGRVRVAHLRAEALERLRAMHNAALATAQKASSTRADVMALAARASVAGPTPASATAPLTGLDRLHDLRRQARERYPNPQESQLASVRSFIAALRNVETPQRLGEIAHEIAADGHAVAEIKRLGPLMVTEFERFSVAEGDGPSRIAGPPGRPIDRDQVR